MSAYVPALTRPWLALLMWAWFDYMAPHRLCYSYAKITIPFSLLTVIVTVVATGFTARWRSFPFTRETMLWLALIIWMGITTIFAMNPFLAEIEWHRALKVQALIMATLMLIYERWQLDALIWTIVASIGFYGIKGGIWTMLYGGASRVHGPEFTFIEDNNDIALALITILPLMRYLQLRSERRWVRLGLAGAMFLTTVAAVASYSRAGFLALIATAIFLILKSRKKFVLVLLVLVAGWFTWSFMPEEWFARMNSIKDYKEDNSAKGRLNAWGFALRIAEERPVTGGGFRVFTPWLFQKYAPNPDDYHEAHSIFLKILAEHGYPGLILFLGMAGFAWRSAAGIRKFAKTNPQFQWAGDLASLTQVAMAGYAVGGAFSNLAYFDLPYHLVTFIVITKLIIRRSIAETERAEEPVPSLENAAAVSA